MAKKRGSNYSPEFRLEAAQLVVKQGYSLKEASEAMNVKSSTLSVWIKQLKSEQGGVMPEGTPMTPEKRKIRELEKRIRRIEMEKEILKKGTALLMSDSFNTVR